MSVVRGDVRSASGLVRVAVGIVLTLCLGAPGHAQVLDRLMAVVSGRVILLSDVALAMRLGLVQASEAGTVEHTLEALIERQLVLMEVERYDPPAPSPDAVEQRLDALASAAGGTGGLARVLRECGVTEEQLRAYVRDDLRIQTYLEQRFASTMEATEAELIEYYRGHPDAFTRDGALRPFEEVRADVAARLSHERRQELVTRWVESLRRRAEIHVPYLTGPRAAG
jgi:hypothetical protein